MRFDTFKRSTCDSQLQVVLVHGFSRVVLAVLLHAAKQGKYFSVVVTESRPNNAGCVLRAVQPISGVC